MLTLSNLSLILGIAGASLLSFDTEFRNYGYVFFIPAFALSVGVLWDKDRSQAFLYAYHFFLSCVGFYQFFLK